VTTLNLDDVWGETGSLDANASASVAEGPEIEGVPIRPAVKALSLDEVWQGGANEIDDGEFVPPPPPLDLAQVHLG